MRHRIFSLFRKKAAEIAVSSALFKTSEEIANPRVDKEGFSRKMADLAPLAKMLFSEFDAYSRLIFFDTETSGLSPETDRIIEFSAIIFEKSGQRSVSMLIREEKPLPREVVLLTKIDDALLNAYGRDQEAAEDDVISLFREGRCLVFAYNLSFDLAFLQAMMARRGCADLLERHDYIDALTVYKDRAPYPHKLSDACLHYGIVSLGEHCSLYDSLALLEVCCRLQQEESVRKWLNRFGYPPKYGVSTPSHVNKISYFPQPYRNFFS